jgi:hypothetical protein
MVHRVIQWATGNVGRAAIRGIVAHPDLELAGCWVHSPAKVGVDAGILAGIAPVGVPATDDAGALLALGADAVVYAPILADPGEVARLLRAGLDVVTPLGWFYPWASGRVDDLAAACDEGGATLHGTGIHPGGITERFPLVISAMCRDIRHVRAEEFSDIRTYETASVVRDVMLFGHEPAAAASSPMVHLLGAGFGQSIDMLAAAIGWELDAERRTTHEMAVATRDLVTPFAGVIAAGTVAAQRFTWQGTVAGEPVITVRVNWLMGQEHLDPPWSYGEERFEVELDADPPAFVTFGGLHPHGEIVAGAENPGITATAMHCVNAVPFVCAAEPGIKTYLDLPPYWGRASGA